MTQTSSDQKPEHIADNILQAALPNVAFDGWRWSDIEQAAEHAGYDRDMAYAVFPSGLPDALDHFADWADREMIVQLDHIDPDDLRIRDRVKTGVLHRFDVLQTHKEAVRYALAYWAVPGRQLRAGEILWRTADRIWYWAGDTSTDHNYYTKRGLLCSVIAPTTLVWMNDEQDIHAPTSTTQRFLDARIENVLTIGKTFGPRIGQVLGKIKTFVS